MHEFSGFSLQVPATSANLGPGFDSFGLALDLHNLFSVEPSDSFSVQVHGYSDQELERPESNLVFAIYRQLCRDNRWQPRPFALTNTNHIPLYGGIGSSASAIAAAIGIANHIHAAKWSKLAMLKIAFGFEHHLDNIAAAIFGGFVATSFNQQMRSEPLLVQKRLARPLCAWLVVPHLRVSTAASRVAMPGKVDYADATFTLAHAAQVALAFEREDWQLLGEAMHDRLHQPFRADQCAQLLDLAVPLRKAGAYSICLSGSGPAVLILCDKPDQAMHQLVDAHMRRHRLDYSQLELGIDNQGMRAANA